MNYEKRLLKFLRDNPTVKMTPLQIAGVWKRSTADVVAAMTSLARKNQITVGKYGVLSLPKMCEGIGGA